MKRSISQMYQLFLCASVLLSSDLLAAPRKDVSQPFVMPTSTRAPRVDAPVPTSAQYPVAPLICDLTPVTGVLSFIRNQIGSVNDSPCDDTVLGVLGDACHILSGSSISSAIASGFSGTFTSIAAIAIAACDLNGVYTAMASGFNGTFTAIAAISTSACDLSGVYTALNAGFNSTQTELNLIYTTMVADFNGTFSAIAAISISACDLSGIYTAVAAGFNGTFSTINAGFNATQTELTLIYTTMVADFNGTFSAIAAISTGACDVSGVYTAIAAGFNGTFTAINVGFNSTQTELTLIYTTEVTGFNSTFTAIAACCNATQTELNLIYTTLVAGFNGTYTAIAAGFNGTFSAINAGFNTTQTELTLIYTTLVADFNGSYTQVAAGFNGTFTAIAACCNATQTELNLIYTTMVNGFNATFTELVLIYTTMVADFNATFTELNLIYTTEVEGFNSTQTELTLIYTTMVADFNGTFSTLRTITDLVGALTAQQSCCSCVTLLTATSFTTVAGLSQTLTVTTAGVYQLCTSVGFNPLSPNTSIVFINTSNVVLDLNAHTLYQSGAGAAFNGIQVNSGLSNIIIQNGIVANTTGTGILMDFSASTGTGMSINSVTTQGCFNGMYINNGRDITIDNSSALKNTTTGALLISCTNVTVTRSQFNDNTGPGLQINSSAFGLVQSTVVRGNGTNGLNINTNTVRIIVQTSRALANTLEGFRNDSSNSTLIGNLGFANGTNFNGNGPFGYLEVGNGAQFPAGTQVDNTIDNISIV